MFMLGFGIQPELTFQDDPEDQAPEPPEAAPPRIQKVRSPVGMTDPRRRSISRGFNAAQPVDRRAELHGRNEMLDALFEAVVDRHNHALVFGARGSGKTSLVRVFADYADQLGSVILYTTCEPGVGLADLLRPCLSGIPSSAMPASAAARFREAVDALPPDAQPRDIVEILGELSGCQIIFILDEFDRITDPRSRAAIATLLKLLSDAMIPVQIVAVGIGRDLLGLVGDHLSLRRHLTPISIGRIDQQAMIDMIDEGAKSANLLFDEDSAALIAAVACGSPYHVRLFCAQAGFAALRRDSSQVDLAAAKEGIASATEAWKLLNPDDGKRFGSFAHAPSALQADLLHLARTAAAKDEVSQLMLHAELGASAETAIAAMGGGLLVDPMDPDRLTFADSVAPQFLIAILTAHEQEPEGSGTTNIISLAETVRQANVH